VNFSPHHKFESCKNFEKTIDSFKVTGQASLSIYSDYLKYHFSLLHKLKSAKHHLDHLEGYLNSQKAQQDNPNEVVYLVNFHFDGFLYVLGSSLDILSREVLCYYNLLPTGKVYFHTAKKTIEAARPADPILTLLDNPGWKSELSDYRNSATHELIISTNYQVDVTVVGGKVNRKIIVPLPDNPRATLPIFKKNKDIVVYCNSTFKRVLSLCNLIYKHMDSEAKTKGTFPL
jgi:hypothetical protein